MMKNHGYTFLLLLSLSPFVQAQQSPSPTPSPADTNPAVQSAEEVGEVKCCAFRLTLFPFRSAL